MQKNILFQDAKMAGFCPTNLTIVGIFAMQETLTSKMLAWSAKPNIILDSIPLIFRQFVWGILFQPTSSSKGKALT